MPNKPPDKVQILKQESLAGGGDPTDNDPFYVNSPLDSGEDAPEVQGLFIQTVSGTSDEQVYISRDNLGNMIFRDLNNPAEVALSDLAVSIGDPGKLIFTIDGGLVYDNSGNVQLKVTS